MLTEAIKRGCQHSIEYLLRMVQVPATKKLLDPFRRKLFCPGDHDFSSGQLYLLLVCALIVCNHPQTVLTPQVPVRLATEVLSRGCMSLVSGKYIELAADPANSQAYLIFDSRVITLAWHQYYNAPVRMHFHSQRLPCRSFKYLVRDQFIAI